MKFALVLASVLLSPVALADVYKCVETDPVTGQKRVTYTNTRGAKGCERLSEDLPVSSVPGAAPAKKPGASSPGAFPRVSSDDQRARDAERRKLLEGELAAEQAALEEARKAFAEADAVRYGNERNYQKKLDRLQPFKEAVEQHERNVEALQKELSGLR
ncbi:DUF4124 domain-containing protein [Denitromonas iodatirespirans]|uniref:DUF4124 domain-containing protein n=1 Tax=Denitromonas iodatirespirans TaxID=2795389 RepID=A0A944D6Z4_DENI1|nr:DUF4124 domain-containing protein [Denitromonas iodatirespirans]MBT0959652.1 DUF4124 domain-containing protein [Denitromonas iodatirespirans]